MIEVKVCKFGDSLGIILPKEVVERLHAEDGNTLFLVEAPDNGYRIAPHAPGISQKMSRVDDILDRYREALDILAK
jgi:putative addiction module antidote